LQANRFDKSVTLPFFHHITDTHASRSNSRRRCIHCMVVRCYTAANLCLPWLFRILVSLAQAPKAAHLWILGAAVAQNGKI
jgi:hypothetical protein